MHSVVYKSRHAQNLDSVGVVQVERAGGHVHTETEGPPARGIVGSNEEVPVAHAPAERGADGGDLDTEGGVEVHVCGDAVFVELRIIDKVYLKRH